MRRKKFKLREAYVELAIIFTLVVFLGYSWFYMYATSSNETKIKFTNNDCENIGGVCKTSCTVNEDISSVCKNGLCCVKRSESYPEDKVYLKFAIANMSIDYCNKIKADILKAECKLKVMDNKNLAFALKYNDDKYCKLISDNDLKNNCIVKLALKSQSIDECKILSGIVADKCITYLAMQKKDPQDCLKVKSELIRNTCFKTLAELTKNKKLCGQITIKPMLNECSINVNLIRLYPNHVDCVKLNEENCIKESLCKPSYEKVSTQNNTKMFEICLYDNEKLCKQTKGGWDILNNDCDCGEKQWYMGFGCVNINYLNIET